MKRVAVMIITLAVALGLVACKNEKSDAKQAPSTTAAKPAPVEGTPAATPTARPSAATEEPSGGVGDEPAADPDQEEAEDMDTGDEPEEDSVDEPENTDEM